MSNLLTLFCARCESYWDLDNPEHARQIDARVLGDGNICLSCPICEGDIAICAPPAPATPEDEGAGITPPPPIHTSQGDASDTLHHRPCKRCGHPVVVEADRYDVFEQMHWSCFHYEYEHDVDRDPDDPCGDVCPARLPDEAYARECAAHEDTIAKLRAAEKAMQVMQARWSTMVEQSKRKVNHARDCERKLLLAAETYIATWDVYQDDGAPEVHEAYTQLQRAVNTAENGQDQR